MYSIMLQLAKRISKYRDDEEFAKLDCTARGGLYYIVIFMRATPVNIRK